MSQYQLIEKTNTGTEKKHDTKNAAFKAAREEAKTIMLTEDEVKKLKLIRFDSAQLDVLDIKTLLTEIKKVTSADIQLYQAGVEPDYDLNCQYLLWINEDKNRSIAFAKASSVAALVTTNLRKIVVKNKEFLDILKAVRLGASVKAKGGARPPVSIVTVNTTMPHILSGIQLTHASFTYKGVNRFFSNFMAPSLIHEVKTEETRDVAIAIWARTLLSVLVDSSKFKANEALYLTLYPIIAKQLKRCEDRYKALKAARYFDREDVKAVIHQLTEEMRKDYALKTAPAYKEGVTVMMSVQPLLVK